MSKLDKLEALEKVATPGPWGEISLEVSCGSYCQGGSGVLELSGYPKIINAKYDDLAFIAEMRNALPKLLALARAAKTVKCYANSDCMGVFSELENALDALEQSE